MFFELIKCKIFTFNSRITLCTLLPYYLYYLITYYTWNTDTYTHAFFLSLFLLCKLFKKIKLQNYHCNSSIIIHNPLLTFKSFHILILVIILWIHHEYQDRKKIFLVKLLLAIFPDLFFSLLLMKNLQFHIIRILV